MTLKEGCRLETRVWVKRDAYCCRKVQSGSAPQGGMSDRTVLYGDGAKKVGLGLKSALAVFCHIGEDSESDLIRQAARYILLYMTSHSSIFHNILDGAGVATD